MAFVNYNNKEITVKIVYYGPALSGKTTCLRYIYSCKEFEKKGKLITLDTDGDRTLFFDFLPIEIGKLGDYTIKIQLYTVPGQVAYDTTRKLVLQGADGVVFVVDSQAIMQEKNIESFNNLKANLESNNLSISEIPIIFQYNKRDLKNILSHDVLNRDLNPDNRSFFPTIATSGENILEGLHTIMKMVIIYLKNRLSIFQKDKTVMFHQDEITDSLLKEGIIKAKTKKDKDMAATSESSRVEIQEEIAATDEEIFELSEPIELLENPIDKDDLLQPEEMPSLEEEPVLEIPMEEPSLEIQPDESELDLQQEEEIFNLDDDNLMNEDNDSEEGAEVTLQEPDEGITPSKPIRIKTSPLESNVTPETKKPDKEKVAIKKVLSIEVEPEVKNIEIPLNIEIPPDKTEFKLNLNLKIVIKKK